MSAQHLDIEQSPATNEQATSASLSPPRRDPEPDADDNFTRKRQRLGGGGAVLRAISTDPESPNKVITSPHEEMVAMTIREHSPPSPSHAPDEVRDCISTGPHPDRETTPNRLPIMLDGARDDYTSPPVIEIIDDDDDDLSMIASVQLNAEDYFRQFPYSDRFRGALNAVRGITEHVQKNQDIPHDLLPSLAQWLLGLPDDTSTHLQNFYLDKAHFWIEFADLVEKLLKRRYQWITACNNGQDDDVSRYPFGDSFGDDSSVDEIFSGFFIAYMQLCSQLFLVDVHLFNQPRSGEQFSSALLSERHLYQLQTLLRTENAPLLNLLRREYGVDVRDVNNRLNVAFLAADGAQNLLKFADEAFRTVPTLLQNHIALSTGQVLSTLGWTICRFPSACGRIAPADYYRGTLLFFRKYSEDIRDPANVADAVVAKDLIVCLSTLVQDISHWDECSASSLADELLNSHTPDSPTTSSLAEVPIDVSTSTEVTDYRQYTDILPFLIENSWKFNLLRKYIVKGRMELRVMSITFMDDALLNLYSHYTSSDMTEKYSPDKHPVLRHLADVLLRGRVVDYIISVDSHPQLIIRSGNIPGFLVVTDRWEDSQTDAIWGTVANSPDPRVIAATITMLLKFLHLMKVTDILYLGQKLHDLPIESFTPEILGFLEQVTKKLLGHMVSDDWKLRGDTARPWSVCVRLLQDTAPRNGATKHDLDIHVRVMGQLHALAPSIPDPDRDSIFLQCMEHIIARSSAATGSVKVICIVGSSGNITSLQQNEELVHQVLEEISLFVGAEARNDPHLHQLSALQYRLELFAFLAYRAGQLVPRSLYTDLSDHIVGPQALSNHARDAAWTHLIHVIKTSPDSDFCLQLISAYIPNMEPQYFTSGLYEFVANYNFPLTRKTFQIEDVEHELLQIPGGELLWSLALSSPPGTIEDYAAHELASRYVQVAQRRGVTLPEVEFAHCELVERCMKELRSAFAKIREEHDGTEQDGKLRFCRVLLFQKQLLELVRQRPEFNRARRADSKVESMDIGTPSANAITFRYQFGDERKTMDVSPDRTIADLYHLLCRATECVKIKVFAEGRKLDVAQHAGQNVADANISGHLLVQPIQRDESSKAVSAPVAGFSEFETSLVKHFDEMYEWMDADDATSQLLFGFLTQFPYRSTITNNVAAGEATVESLFPPGKFFQAKYAAQAIHSRLKDQLRSSNLDEAFLLNAIKLLDRSLLSEELFGTDASVVDMVPLVGVFISAMLDFLRERPSSDLLKDYFSDAPALARRLTRILATAIHATNAAKIVQECYATILEASLCCPLVWQTFWEHPEVAQIHRTLLLTDQREDLREYIKLKALSVCGGHLPSSCSLVPGEIASRYWSVIASILPDASQASEQSTQLFELAQHVFRVYDEHYRSEDNLRALLHSWSSLLLAHNHSEIPGRYEADNVVMGFTKLLLCLLPSLKSYKNSLNAGALISSVFHRFLFNSAAPLALAPPAYGSTSALLPVLDSNVRRELYDLMLALADDGPSYKRLLRLCGDVENRPVDNVMPSLSVDRALEVRSQTGYVGLQNPRAICYMNSLLAQLFMNLNFRQFMLSLEVKEGDGSQRLLLETQRLFATMQNSYRRAADPRPFAACVMTLDKTPIDIGVQMDADEFYNLLFDQWEAQLVNEQDKRRFRNFYGGQMLQQVKSKECEHVSERADSFFALQCDVQGKATLQESLQAFVQGDVMEGDNKYKCESCGGKFVDAVKRTCLKSAPDNLIFHLKRFDFDLTDFSRKKVHDNFDFPETIDVGLYNVEHLSDPSKPHTEDLFDLVGVVVHYGNCENGHYYSYIRKRPCPTSNASPTWLNFNDYEVDPFNPAEIPQKTFGGMAEDPYSHQFKMYSAYMLFYQRRSAIAQDQQQWTISSQRQPPQVEVPQSIKNDVDLKNEMFVREYCLFDPYHSAFVRQLHGASRRINNGSCSEDHDHEMHALDIFLAHLGRVAWRQQTTDIFEEAMVHLHRYSLSCEGCCKATLQWLARDDEVLFNLLLRCPHPTVRSQTRSFLIDCLKFLRGKDSYLCDTATDSDMVLDVDGDTGVLVLITKRLTDLAESSVKGTRGWDDLYLTLTQIAEMGMDETVALLDRDLLAFCLRLFCLQASPRVADGYDDFHRVFQKRTKIYNRLIGFVATILSHMDINLPSCDTSQRTSALNSECTEMPLTPEEKGLLLYWHRENRAYAVVDKMVEVFDQSKTEMFYPGDIVKWMTRSLDNQIQSNISTMILQGISELNNPYCDSYLRIASSYCEATRTAEALSKVCDTVVEAADSDEPTAPSGRDVVGFFWDVLKSSNPHIPASDVYWCLMSRSHKFAHVLLVHADEEVRNGAYELIREIYIKFMEDPAYLDEAYNCARNTSRAMMKRIAYECRAGMPRRQLEALLQFGKFLTTLLYELDKSEDADLAVFKDADDKALLHQWQIEVETQVRMLPEVGLLSPGEGAFDGSDYGSESDEVELLGP
ncbi:uncharacterized protein M421DRAFT_7661 [Didymella exigua CBS 183.55]|uniref:USP domain-containing protein n=1 Tax=Didymella exigua CBS 183.55 TaxID=1150837 RepID=A0A6A5REV6_9PLEO|nr:uncharacterized protein M421DRAFT_7661 [Didymella exigua CBS 183.55]KAF1925634.1 hypothetical protein M421DRAFT_7661 [Didymella exigua CBS 183.55]